MQASNRCSPSSPTLRFAPYPTMSSSNQLQFVVSPTMVPDGGLIQPFHVQNYILSNNYYAVDNSYFSQAHNSLHYYQELAYIQQKYGPTFPQPMHYAVPWNQPFNQTSPHEMLELQELDTRETSYSTDSASETGEDDSNQVRAVTFSDRNSESIENHSLTSRCQSHVQKAETETVSQTVDEMCSLLVSSKITTPSGGRNGYSMDSSCSTDTSWVSADSPSSQASDSGISGEARNSILSTSPIAKASGRSSLFNGTAARTVHLHPKKLLLLQYEREQKEEERKRKISEQPSSYTVLHKRVASKANEVSPEPRRSSRSRKQPMRFGSKK